MPLAIECRLTQEQRRDVIVDDRLDRAGDVIGLAQPDQSIGRMDLHPDRLGVLGEPNGLEPDDLHGAS